MSDAIDRAAEDAARAITAMGGKWADRTPLSIARALAELGLLAPAPLREELSVTPPPGQVEINGQEEWDAYAAWCREHGTNPQRRWVTDWFPADAVNRAEGDGRAVSHE